MQRARVSRAYDISGDPALTGPEESVSSGGRIDGDMFMNTWGMARFGGLFRWNGRWADRSLGTKNCVKLDETARAAPST